MIKRRITSNSSTTLTNIWNQNSEELSEPHSSPISSFKLKISHGNLHTASIKNCKFPIQLKVPRSNRPNKKDEPPSNYPPTSRYGFTMRPSPGEHFFVRVGFIKANSIQRIRRASITMKHWKLHERNHCNPCNMVPNEERRLLLPFLEQRSPPRLQSPNLV